MYMAATASMPHSAAHSASRGDRFSSISSFTRSPLQSQISLRPAWRISHTRADFRISKGLLAELGIVFGYLANGYACTELLDDLSNRNPCALEHRSARADLSITLDQHIPTPNIPYALSSRPHHARELKGGGDLA
ncbi:hypothetical protein BA899_09695 [Spiribacter sp. SSL99]|nr:hypothetical protein BA899_09695 [Spiribacter sp. SSL99]